MKKTKEKNENKSRQQLLKLHFPNRYKLTEPEFYFQ